MYIFLLSGKRLLGWPRMVWTKKHILVISFLLVEAAAFATPQRIVSASLASDEIVWSLFSSPQDRARIVALSPLVDDPHYSHITEEVKKVRQRFPASVEGLVKLQADFVLLASFNRPAYKQALTKLKVPHAELEHFRKLTDISENILHIGKALGKVEAARRLNEDFLRQLRDLSPAPTAPQTSVTPQRPTVLMYTPAGQAMAGDTIFDDIVRHCGGVNAASQDQRKGWPQLNAETVLKLNPDFVVLSDRDEPQLRASKIWSGLQAIKCDRVITIRAATLWSSSHHVIGAVEKICRALSHPVQKRC